MKKINLFCRKKIAKGWSDRRKSLKIEKKVTEALLLQFIPVIKTTFTIIIKYKCNFLLRDHPQRKNSKNSDIMHISINPLPPYPNNDIFKSDKLIQPMTPTLLYGIMTNALINGIIFIYIGIQYLVY